MTQTSHSDVGCRSVGEIQRDVALIAAALDLLSALEQVRPGADVRVLVSATRQLYYAELHTLRAAALAAGDKPHA